jgi:hypothetical protein
VFAVTRGAAPGVDQARDGDDACRRAVDQPDGRRGLVADLGDEPALRPGGGFTLGTGASGAGKSTLLRVPAGALRPMAGSVRATGASAQATRQMWCTFSTGRGVDVDSSRREDRCRTSSAIAIARASTISPEAHRSVSDTATG